MSVASTEWSVGILFAILSNVISNIGLNFQKLAHSKRNQSLHNSENHISSPTSIATPLGQIDSFAIRQNTRAATSDHNSSPDLNSVSIEERAQAESPNDHDPDNDHSPLQAKTNFDFSQPPNEFPNTTKVNNTSNMNERYYNNDNNSCYLTNPLWITGLTLQIIGGIFDFAALGFAPQSVVAPLGSLTLVVNVFLAPIMQKEKPGLKTIIATCIIIAGSVITVFFSATQDSIQTTADVLNLHKSIEFLCYAVSICATMFVLWFMVQFCECLSNSVNEYDIDMYNKKYRKVHRFCIGALSGIMGAQNVFFAKLVSKMIVLTAKRNKEHGGDSGDKDEWFYDYWQFYLMLFGLGFTIIFQLKWLNSGLKLFSALHIAPIFQSFWITVSVVSGLIVFNEFGQMTSEKRIIFPFGVIITVFGVCYLTIQSTPDKINVKTSHSDTEKHETQKLNCEMIANSTTVAPLRDTLQVAINSDKQGFVHLFAGEDADLDDINKELGDNVNKNSKLL